MNKCIVLDDATDWQQRAELAEALALTLQSQRDAAEAETAQALEALTMAREALEAIDRHVVGAYTTYMNDDGNADAEPCDECSEMREIASHALAAMKRARSQAELTAARAELEAARALADAVTAYFNKRGSAHAMRAGNDDILTMADALAEYGAIEQQKASAR